MYYTRVKITKYTWNHLDISQDDNSYQFIKYLLIIYTNMESIRYSKVKSDKITPI